MSFWSFLKWQVFLHSHRACYRRGIIWQDRRTITFFRERCCRNYWVNFKCYHLLSQQKHITQRSQARKPFGGWLRQWLNKNHWFWYSSRIWSWWKNVLTVWNCLLYRTRNSQQSKVWWEMWSMVNWSNNVHTSYRMPSIRW